MLCCNCKPFLNNTKCNSLWYVWGKKVFLADGQIELGEKYLFLPSLCGAVPDYFWIQTDAASDAVRSTF